MASSPFTVTEYVINGQHIREYPRATATPDAPLKLAVKKYTPKDNPNPKPGDVTIIGVHGTAFPKELYEPLWEELLARGKQDGFSIRAIWMADSANQGASGVLNEKVLGNDPTLSDNTRDLLHMVNHFSDDMPRPIMGIGHSYGAPQLVLLSLIHPRLFAGLVLLEPWMVDMMKGKFLPMSIMTAAKRDIWPSHSDAVRHFRKVYPNWDARVLDCWNRYGLRELPTTVYPDMQSASDGQRPVTLKTTKDQEVFTYSRPNPRVLNQLHASAKQDTRNPPEALDGPHDATLIPDMFGTQRDDQALYRVEPVLADRFLPHVWPSVLFLSGAQSDVYRLGHHRRMAHKTGTKIFGSGGMTAGRVNHVVVQNAGHMLPMEKVGQTSDILGPWIAGELNRWKEAEHTQAEGWHSLSAREKSTISNQWIAAVASVAPDSNKRLKNMVARRGSKL